MREVSETVRRARVAQAAVEGYTQTQVDDLCAALAWAVVREDRAEGLAKWAVDESHLGNHDDKVDKVVNYVLGTLADLQAVRTVGVVEEAPERGLVTIAKPVGVVAAVVPATSPEVTPAVKAMLALKGRNAIVFAPPSRARDTTAAGVDHLREACATVGAPPDLVQILPVPSRAATQELMRQADLVVATGGAAVVRAAYSSGTPAYGVGVGNAVHVVDETADLDDAAEMIAKGKTYDHGTSCMADNAVVVHDSVGDALRQRLVAQGGYLCSTEEKAALRRTMWPDGAAVTSADVMGRPARVIARLAGLRVGDDRTFLLVEEDGVGPGHPFSGEKLSVVLALYSYGGPIGNAVELVNAITAYQGLGHTCGIHTHSDAHVEALAMGTRTARVLVNQNLTEGAGSRRNGLPFTMSLGCGTWGGNITADNLTARHFVNLTSVSRPIAPRMISREQLFAGYWSRHGT
jgi:sulfoacetaldehyde dehydrogenase